jgi:hypothetical protein
MPFLDWTGLGVDPKNDAWRNPLRVAASLEDHLGRL